MKLKNFALGAGLVGSLFLSELKDSNAPGPIDIDPSRVKSFMEAALECANMGTTVPSTDQLKIAQEEGLRINGRTWAIDIETETVVVYDPETNLFYFVNYNQESEKASVMCVPVKKEIGEA